MALLILFMIAWAVDSYQYDKDLEKDKAEMKVYPK